MPISAVSFLLD